MHPDLHPVAEFLGHVLHHLDQCRAQSAPASATQAVAEPDWAKALSDKLTRVETIMTQASDNIARLQGDEAAVLAAFTAFQAKAQTDVAAASAKASDLQTQLDAAKAAAATAVASDPEAIPADVQTALDAAHVASQALVASMGGLTATVAAPTAPTAEPAPVADLATTQTPPAGVTAATDLAPAAAAPDTPAT